MAAKKKSSSAASGELVVTIPVVVTQLEDIVRQLQVVIQVARALEVGGRESMPPGFGRRPPILVGDACQVPIATWVEVSRTRARK